MDYDLQSDKVQKLYATLSRTRLSSYHGNSKNSLGTKNEAEQIKILGCYFWNIAICESFYPIINNFEVALRNHLHLSIANLTQDNNWLINKGNYLIKGKYDLGELKRIIKEKSPARDDEIIPEFTLGFWINLSTNTMYEQSIIIKLFRNREFMPFLPTSLRTSKTLRMNFRPIRELRNRIFHQEPIFKNNLQRDYENIMKGIAWINPTLAEMTTKISRFSVVIDSKTYYEDLVLRLLNTPQ
jgi:hypothetical protein